MFEGLLELAKRHAKSFLENNERTGAMPMILLSLAIFNGGCKASVILTTFINHETETGFFNMTYTREVLIRPGAGIIRPFTRSAC